MKEFRVTQADNGGFVIEHSNPGEPYKPAQLVAAVSSARDLIKVIADMYDVTPELECVDADAPWEKAPDGWIDWKGGECPVAPDTIVDVKYADGAEPGKNGRFETGERAYLYNWKGGFGSSISAYKVCD